MKCIQVLGFAKTTSVAALLVFSAFSVQAGDNAAFTQNFEAYQAELETLNEQLVEAIKTSKYGPMAATADKLKALAEKFVAIAKADDNKGYAAFSSNISTHTTELQETIAAKDNVELIVLAGLLSDHLGFLQSGNAPWLRVYYPEKVANLGKAIAAKNQAETEKNAEMLHVAANRIATSSGMQKDYYTNVRWVDDTLEVSVLGDAIIDASRHNDFTTAGDLFKKLERAFAKWDKSFK